MKISIIGLGWFGEALAHELKTQHEVFGTTRTDEKVLALSEQKIFPQKLTLNDVPSEEMLAVDVIILNIPPFPDQLAWFKSWKWNLHAHIIFVSSTSVYGKNTGLVDETTTSLPETDNAKILLEEEKWIETFPNYTILRFAGLIGPGRHPGFTLSGKTNVPGGNLPVNLVHLQDCIDFTKLVIEKVLCGETFNLVHPEHPSRRDYYQSYCRQHNLPMPEFIDSVGSGKIISSSKVLIHYQFSGPISPTPFNLAPF